MVALNNIEEIVQEERLKNFVKPIIKRLLKARDKAVFVRVEVNKIDEEILQEHTFINLETNESIIDSSDIPYCSDEEQDKYYNLRDEKIRKAGYKVKPGYCPALIAEQQKLKIEDTLLDTVGEFFPYVNSKSVLALGVEKRKELIRLLIRLFE